MDRAVSHDPEHERELRARILAGSQDPDDYKALAEILLDTAGREDEGVAVLERAIELPLPTCERAAVAAEIGWWFYQLGRLERAITVAGEALSLIGERGDTERVLMISGFGHMTMAFCVYLADRPESDRHSLLALQAFERLISEYPDSENLAAATLHAAEVYVLRGDYAKAIVFYERAMQADPSKQHRLNCLVLLGSALRSHGRHVEAEERLREALALAGADRRALLRIQFELGKVHHLSNRIEEAISAFQQALATLRLNPFLRADREYVAEIRWELGHLYYDVRRYREAKALFREALTDLPETHPNLYCGTLIYLGHCYALTGEHAKARDCFAEVLGSEAASDDEKLVAQEWLSSLPPIPPPRVH